MVERLDRVCAGDRFYDYCLWPYEPVAPADGKLRSSTLLWQSFEALGAPVVLRQIVEALEKGLGPSRIVWGVKRIGEKFSWELYFYDYQRLQRSVSIERVIDLISPYIGCSLSLSPTRPYFMFSLDLDAELGMRRRKIDEISVYLGNPGSSVSSGLCYQLTANGLRYDNLYYFFDRKTEWDDIVGKVAASIHIDIDRLDVSDILWPQLTDCGVIVVANKKYNDGVYFSRIRIDQLLGFLDRLDYPKEIRAFLHANRTDLDHLLYDVGIDYHMVDGRIVILKSAYYGVV